MKNIKRILSVTLALLLVFSSMTFSAFATETDEFADYTAISTKEQLTDVRNGLDGKYYLTNDIVFDDAEFKEGGAFYNDGNGFAPISLGIEETDAFTGVFDGNGHSIKNLKISVEKTGEDYAIAALFGYSSGTVRNLNVIDADISVNAHVAAASIIVSGNEGVIENCYASGTVAVTSPSVLDGAALSVGGISSANLGSVNNCVSDAKIEVTGDNPSIAGGVVGTNIGTISYCTNNGTVTALLSDGVAASAAGVAGVNMLGSIEKSINNGEVRANALVGGISATNMGNIANCINTAPVELTSVKLDAETAQADSYNAAGGITAVTLAGVSDCINTGDVTAIESDYVSYIGAITGIAPADTVTDCYYSNADVVGVGYTDGEDTSVQLTAAQLQDPAAMSGLNFNTDWKIEDGQLVLRAPDDISFVDSSVKFKDVAKDSWYKEYIDYAATFEIINGVTATEVKPNNNITRAQFVQILANIEGINTDQKVDYTNFRDVSDLDWYCTAVSWAYVSQIVDGVSETEFNPNGNLTREQMCTMLVRYTDYKEITLKNEVSRVVFNDDSQISDWAYDYVAVCQQAGIVEGIDGSFKPKNKATRAQVAAIMTRVHQQYMR